MIGLYFSGTGNSRHCLNVFLDHLGKDIQRAEIEDPQSIALLEKSEEVVLAYPVYLSNIPKIVRDFIQDNGTLFRGRKVYLIATMGLFSGDGAGCAARLLKKQGALIQGSLHVKMPDCVCDVKLLKKSLEENGSIVKQAEQKIKNAAMRYLNGNPEKQGLGLPSRIAGLFGQRLWFYGHTMRYSNKLKLNGTTCIGCGLCACNCPMKNLTMIEGKPKAAGKCTMCYRCISQCPTKTITLLGKKVVEQCRIENYTNSY